MGTKWQVQVWEFERGWGRRPDGCRTFDTLEEAKAYQKKVNGYNTGTAVPDCYSTADDPRPVELKEPAPKPTLTLADKMRLNIQAQKDRELEFKRRANEEVVKALEEIKTQVVSEIDAGGIPHKIKLSSVLDDRSVMMCPISDKRHPHNPLYQAIVETWADEQGLDLSIKSEIAGKRVEWFAIISLKTSSTGDEE